jgi:hypothetical protein
MDLHAPKKFLLRHGHQNTLSGRFLASNNAAKKKMVPTKRRDLSSWLLTSPILDDIDIEDRIFQIATKHARYD